MFTCADAFAGVVRDHTALNGRFRWLVLSELSGPEPSRARRVLRTLATLCRSGDSAAATAEAAEPDSQQQRSRKRQRLKEASPRTKARQNKLRDWFGDDAAVVEAWIEENFVHG